MAGRHHRWIVFTLECRDCSIHSLGIGAIFFCVCVRALSRCEVTTSSSLSIFLFFGEDDLAQMKRRQHTYGTMYPTSSAAVQKPVSDAIANRCRRHAFATPTVHVTHGVQRHARLVVTETSSLRKSCIASPGFLPPPELPQQPTWRS